MRPEVSGRNKAAEQLLKTASELGFTPNSRSRMNVPTKPPTTEPTLDDILKGK
jgi:phage terminase small subunit